MKSGIYTALAALAASLVQAHGGAPGAPKIFGRSIDAISLEQPAVRHRALRSIPAGPDNVALQKRANANGQCGAAYGSCAAGQCCSAEGYCGTTSDYCAAPDCQFNYGPACDANKTPAGTSTSSIARPLLGSVPYGGDGIYDCVANGVIALTFDDGPYIYTNDLLDLLAQYGAKATFFITGNNLGKGAIDTTWATVIKRMATEGHQIASHTWSHQDLSNVTQAQRKDQMVKNEMAFRNILGYFPTYMRPPYSSCSAACQTDLKNLGYHITYFDLDTDDYDNTTPQLQQNAKNNFDNAVKGSNPATSDFLSIEHDIHEQTVHNLTVYILQRMQTLGYKGVTVGDCLGDPIKNWYRNAGTAPPTTTASTPASTRTTTSSSTSSTSTSTRSTSSTTSAASPTSTLTVTTDASCGGTKTCQGSQWGNCCSVNGWCGSTDAYCGAGCQPLFGTCSGSAGTTSAKPSTTSTTSSTSTKPTTTSTTSTKATTTTTSTTSPTSTVKVTTDGSCGTGKTCQGSQWGNCCSQYGWCGSAANYCGTGCQKAFGSCT